MTTKNCANGPELVLQDLCEKSFLRNVRLPYKTLCILAEIGQLQYCTALTSPIQ